MREYEQRYFSHRVWESTPQVVIDSVIDEISFYAEKYCKKPLQDLRILDVGCGDGDYVVALSKKCKRVVGVEPYHDAYVVASKKTKKTSNAHVVYGPIEDVSIRGKFDVVLSLTTIEHMPHHHESYKKILSLLASDGFMYLTAPNKLWPYEHHYRLFFLSYLPRNMANFYVRITKRGQSYDDSSYSLTYFGIRKLFNTLGACYEFVLPRNVHSSYIGCGLDSKTVRKLKLFGVHLIRMFPVLWIFSKGFIMVVRNK